MTGCPLFSAAVRRGNGRSRPAGYRGAQCRAVVALASFLATVQLADIARADTVSLVSGRTIEGKISFDAKDGLVVLPKGQPSQRVEVKDVLSLQVDAPAVKPPARMVTLVSGAQIAGTELLLFNDTELRLKRPDNTIFTVNSAVVSSINFQPDRPFKNPLPGVTGVVVGEADVSEGEILSIVDSGGRDRKDGGEVKISSVLFGLQTFAVGSEARAVLLRPVGVSKANYIVRTNDGSVLHAVSLNVDRGKLIIDTDTAGRMQINGDQVRSIELGPASADGLSSLRSTLADGTVLLPASGATELPVGGRYRAMVLTLGVPDDYVPTRAVTFTILADGKEIARVGPLTSVDPAASVTRPIEGVSTITVRTDASGPAELGVAGQITSGRFIRTK